MSSAIPADILALMRPSAAELEPYDPAFSAVEVNLAANENGFGMPGELKEGMAHVLAEADTSRYPRPLSDELRDLLACGHGLERERVIVGNGGDELLFNLFLAFGGSGKTVLCCPPDFSVYRIYARLAECDVREVPRDRESFALCEEALVSAAADADIVLLTSPNNPTGDLVDRGLLLRVLKACPGIVLLDEAYIEFAGDAASAKELLDAWPRLLILRTFSKAFALAGARVGYMLGSAGVIAALAAVRQPYSVNLLSQLAAIEAARHPEAFAPAIDAIASERERMLAAYAAMAPLGVRAWPSAANFILVRVPDAHRVWERLRDEHSILVRDFSRTPGLEGCLRITVGTPYENDRVLEALSALLGHE